MDKGSIMTKLPPLAPPPWAQKRQEPLRVEETAHGFEYWLGRPWLSADLREQLGRANVLIVPVEKFRDHEGPVFTQGTEELFHFLKEQGPDGVVVDVCVEDQDFQEYALHHETIEIAEIVFRWAIWPILINLISAYISFRLGKRRGTVKVTLTAEDPDGQARSFRYDGPAEDFKTVMQALRDGERPALPALPPAKEKVKKERRRRR
jgi:hypothetical protein